MSWPTELKLRILLVDDHVLIREALRGVLRELARDVDVLEAGTCSEAFELVGQHSDLALVLLDLGLPDRDGLDALVDLRERCPALAVAMLSGHNDRGTVLKALEAGAQGYIPKTSSREVLLGALRLILAGGVYIPPEVLGRGQPGNEAPAAYPAGQQPRPTPGDLGLTGRQLDVLALMMQGKSNKLICRALDLAEPTVKNHVSAILKALGVSNRTEAVLAAAEHGWDLSNPDD